MNEHASLRDFKTYLKLTEILGVDKDDAVEAVAETVDAVHGCNFSGVIKRLKTPVTPENIDKKIDSAEKKYFGLMKERKNLKNEIDCAKKTEVKNSEKVEKVLDDLIEKNVKRNVGETVKYKEPKNLAKEFQLKYTHPQALSKKANLILKNLGLQTYVFDEKYPHWIPTELGKKYSIEGYRDRLLMWNVKKVLELIRKSNIKT